MGRIDRGKQRQKRHLRVRKRVIGTADRPRLCVRKSLRHVYAQLVDDASNRVLVAVSTLDPAVREEVNGSNAAAAAKVGDVLAARAAEKGIESAVFDRGGYPYHGVVAALADACRKGGLRF